MISKNMHKVDVESGEVTNTRPSVTADTSFCESAQQTFPVRKGKMSDIPEEPEDLSDSSHPSIVPLKDAPPITKHEGHNHAPSSVLYTTWSNADQVQIHNLPTGGNKMPKESYKPVYTILHQSHH
ncbi:uncharacterized protein si:dkey-33i11.1 [Antennarius striatus]|uniref:uncharacterized protein si:dkey-33i11.1 n=1 Tax=Antennarius striatus TaxID=241820 RepID=UPI0035B1ED35